jgi:putative mRNA 3-end processing factor
MRFTDLLTPTPAGLFSPPGDFHIDPTRPAKRAVITHGRGVQPCAANHAAKGAGKRPAASSTLARAVMSEA